ncbi:MAG: transcriptional regulator, AsnC family [Firmicutes bacterium]|nr:transcriptional regulator, AsnC family [Bacillota bacterium]
MDNVDLKAIKQLMKQARTTWAELGALLGLSAPAAADRVHKLEVAGVIKGYSALVDPDAIGCGLAALISIIIEDPDQRANLLRKVDELPEIQECHHVAGDVDYILKVRCAGTRDLERLISKEIKSLSGIKTRTMVILSTIKETPILPLSLVKE